MNRSVGGGSTHLASHAVVSIDGQVYLLAGAREAMQDPRHNFVSVYSRGDVRDPSNLVAHVCAEFGISTQDLKWLSSDLSPRAWLLWRLDDNGNQEPMWYFKEAAHAEAVAKFYTDRGHKQLYVVRPAAGGGSFPGTVDAQPGSA